MRDDPGITGLPSTSSSWAARSRVSRVPLRIAGPRASESGSRMRSFRPYQSEYDRRHPQELTSGTYAPAGARQHAGFTMIAIDVRGAHEILRRGARAPRHRSLDRRHRTNHRPARAQRRGQDDASSRSSKACAPRPPDRCRCSGSIRRTRPARCARGIGVQLQTTAFMRGPHRHRNAEAVCGALSAADPAEGGSGSAGLIPCSSGSISSTRPRRWCADCPVDSGSASPWPWRCCTIRISTSSMSRPRASIRSRAGRFTTSCWR